MADTPEQSDYTSIQERLGITPTAIDTPENNASNTILTDSNNAAIQAKSAELMPFSGCIKADTPSHHLPYNFAD